MHKVVRVLPNARQVRADVSDDTRHRSIAKAGLVLIPSVFLYLASITALVASPWWAWPVLSVLTGLTVGLLFVLAHDAAHDSLTPSRLLNGVIGRVLFIPAWHNFTGWVHAHNHVHHGWTNLQPRDYVWSPVSLKEYQSRSPAGRFWVRLCRWWPAFGLYYGWEILMRRILIVQPEVKQLRARVRWHLDNLFVVGGVVVQSWLIVTLARRWDVQTSIWSLLLFAQVIPFTISAWLVGFLTYLHHTHPSIPWFADQDEWTFYMGQVRGTTHVHFPGPINRLIHNIMEHTAHHVDPRIPLYHLTDAQQQLEELHQPVVTLFGVRSFLYTQRVCQLYDFTEHCWLSFSGNVTSARTVSEELLRAAAETNGQRRLEPVRQVA